MYSKVLLLLCLLVGSNSVLGVGRMMKETEPLVGAFYFPWYQMGEPVW